MSALQRAAEKRGVRVVVHALQGSFVTPGKALATLEAEPGGAPGDAADFADSFIVGDDRTFDEDPRFGLVTLSEIAARALSPAVNDPGTAIDITGTFVRLFARWVTPGEDLPVEFDRISVPPLSAVDMFDDAFTAIARDGAATIEVATRLQKAFRVLMEIGNDDLHEAALRHSRLAQARADLALKLPEERDQIRALAAAVVAARYAVDGPGRTSRP